MPPREALAQQVAAAHAVRVVLERDETRARVRLARQRERRHERDLRVRIGALRADQPEVGGEVADADAAGIAILGQTKEGEVGVGVAQRRFAERGVVLRAELVALDEHHVEHDGARLLRRETFEQIRVHDARPWPAPGIAFLHLHQAVLVDVDQHDVRVGGERRGLPLDHAVEQAVLERAQPLQREHLQREQRGHRRHHEREAALHRPSITSFSAWNRSTLASISSRLIDTLSTLMPSGMWLA